VPLGVGVWLPVRGVDLWLDVNDPRVVAEVGRDVDRRGHTDRRVDGRGSLGGGARPSMAAAIPLAATAANPNLFIAVPSSFCLLLRSSRGAKSRLRDCVGRYMVVPLRPPNQ